MKGIVRVTKGAAITALLVILSVFLLGVGGARALDSIAQNNSIGSDAACNFAYIDAGVLPENAILVSCRFDFEKGVFVYEVEFVSDGVVYEYVVRASDGIVLAREEEMIEGYRAGEQTRPAPVTTATQTPPVMSGNFIGVEEAKAQALAKAGITDDGTVTFTTAKLDDDDGTVLYDIKFYVNNTEYEVEVDALSGSVISYNAEEEHTPAQPAQGTVTPQQPAQGTVTPQQPAVTQPQQPAVTQPQQPAQGTVTPQQPAVTQPAQPAPAQPAPAQPAQPAVTPPAQPAQPAPAQPTYDDDDDDDDYDDDDDDYDDDDDDDD